MQSWNGQVKYYKDNIFVSSTDKISGAVITATIPSHQIVEGMSINLTCDAAGSISTREWRKDDQPLTLGINVALHDNNRVLSFSAVNVSDEGGYSCNISNPINSQEARFQMDVQRKCHPDQ